MGVPNAANWALSKRTFHWGLAIAVTVALLAPKPDDGSGLVHIAAGTVALALVLARLGTRLLGEVRPFVKDAWRLKWPNLSKGPKGFAPLMMQGARIGGFLFLAIIPIAVGLGVVGLGQGEDSPLLEVHEAAGTAIMVLAIGHATAILVFALFTKYNLLAITLFGGARSFFEGGVRGALGLALGSTLGLAALAYVWGPYDLGAKIAAQSEQESGEAPSNEIEDDD